MATTDVRDPRIARRPVGEQLDRVAGSLDVTLSLLTARLGEVIKTQQDGNALLAVLARTVSDDDTVGTGLAGVRPNRVPSISTKKMLMAANPETRLGPRNMQPYSAGIDYNIGVGAAGTLASQTRTGVRSGVANWLTGRATYLADQYEVHPGEHIGKTTGDLYRENPDVQMDSSGRYRNLTTGRWASSEDAIQGIMTGAERAKLGSHLATANTMARMGEAWQGGAGIGRSLAAALPESALKYAGGAAVAVTAANQALQWAQGQHEQNRAFQEVYGGSNADQYGERASQWWNRNVTGRFSLLGGGAYDDLFKGGMNMGLRGSDRNQYISTGADIMGTGVSSSQTKQIMDMSIEAGLGLSGLARAIREVNNSARDAGINAKHARDMFIANYTAGTEIMFGSQNAKNFATLTTQGQLAQARPFQNITGTGMLQNNAITQMRASQLGMTLGEIEVAQTRSPGGTIASGEQALKQRIDAMPNPEGKGKSVRQVVAEFIQQNGGYNAKYDQIALGEAMKANGWNEDFCHRILASFSIDDGGQQFAPGYLANLYTKDSPGSIALRNDSKNAIDFAPKMVTGTGQNLMSQFGSASEISTLRARALTTLGLNIRSGENAGDLAQLYVNSVAGKNLSPAVTANWDVLKGKQLLPGVERLIEQADTLGLNKKSMVRVKTGDGYRVITLEQAMRDFPDQVASAARLVGGVRDEYMDKTVGEITGAPASTTSGGKKISYGQTTDEFAAEQEKKKKKDGDTSNQKIMLDLTPEAKLLLKKMPDPYYSSSAPTSGAGT